MPKTTFSNNYEARLLDNIKEHGWSFTAVGQDTDFPCFAYTIGLSHSFGIPEILIVGIDGTTAHHLICNLLDKIKADPKSRPENHCDSILKGYSVVFVPVPVAAYDGLLGSAQWFYDDSNAFEALQMVWPNKNGIYPWHEAAETGFQKAQPVLGAMKGH